MDEGQYHLAFDCSEAGLYDLFTPEGKFAFLKDLAKRLGGWVEPVEVIPEVKRFLPCIVYHPYINNKITICCLKIATLTIHLAHNHNEHLFDVDIYDEQDEIIFSSRIVSRSVLRHLLWHYCFTESQGGWNHAGSD